MGLLAAPGTTSDWVYVVGLFVIIAPVLLVIMHLGKKSGTLEIRLFPPRFETKTISKRSADDTPKRKKPNKKKNKKRKKKRAASPR